MLFSMRSWISSRASFGVLPERNDSPQQLQTGRTWVSPLFRIATKYGHSMLFYSPRTWKKYKKSTIPRSNPDFCTHPQKSDPTIDTFALNIHICRFPEIGVVPPNHPFWMILSIIYHLLWGYVPPFMETSTSVGSNMGTRVPHLVGGFNTSEKYESQLG